MGFITVKSKGDFAKATQYLNRLKKSGIDLNTFYKYGVQGVLALSQNTPVDTGLTAASWEFEIQQTKDQIKLKFNNTNIQNGVPIAIILQYGHATRNGGWVEGRDYINPAIQPLFDKLAEDAWKEVSNA